MPWMLVPLMVTAQAQARTPAPGPACLDAHAVREARQAGPRVLAVATTGGQRYRLDLGTDCPVVAGQGQATLLAREGWICGRGEGESVRVGGQACPVAAVRVIDAREYAGLARQADDIATMDTVEVKGERRRGFGGSYSYCFRSQYVRSWSEDGRGLMVEVSPRHSGGHRYYRVELAGMCPELDASPPVEFQSGVGIGLICGNPGDRVVVRPERGVSAGARIPCVITAVYPHEPAP